MFEEGIKEVKNSKVIVFDGANLKNEKDLFTEFAKKSEFPDYFGYNRNALDECLTDLEWIEFTSLTIGI